MRLLCVIDSLGSGGAQRQMVGLAKAFKENGIEVSLLTYHREDFYLPELKEAQIIVSCIQESNYLMRLIRIRQYIRKGKYDVVLSFLTSVNFICECAAFPFKRWKLIVGERGGNPREIRSFKGRLFRVFHFLADYVVVNSYQGLQLLKKANPLLSDRKCKVIYNLFDMVYWQPNPSYMPLQNDKFKLIVAASHQYLKNLTGLIKGIHNLSVNDKKRLIVEWYGDERGDNSFLEARQFIAEYGLNCIINFYAATTDILEKMQHADAIGLFSYFEGFPNVICEGMAVGKLIVCSKVSDIPQILADDGNLLIDPYNPLTITEALQKMLNMPLENLIKTGKRNREKAIKAFSKDAIVDQYLSLL